ncbi:MAG: hypothetical protein H6Q90_3643 [Deltaproteobacteria bacterium]|nr:hypothetical protein [Deltaproteobacteria bacterium]
MRVDHAVLVAVLVPALGCNMVLPSGRRPTGEPLVVEVRDKSYNVLRSHSVGQIELKDSSGRDVGTANLTENRLVHVPDVRWRALQGVQPISDEDLFRIAGDTEAAEIDRGFRRTSRLLMWTGALLTFGGLGEMVLARELEWTETSAGKAAFYPAYAGLIFGSWMMFAGLRRQQRDAHPVPLDRAREAAERYNARLPPPTARSGAPAPAAVFSLRGTF